MNKKELITEVAHKSDLPKRYAEKAVNAVFETIGESLTQGDKVQIVGFGTFEVRHHDEREGRNPQTQEAIKISASSTPAFKAGKQLKDRVNGR